MIKKIIVPLLIALIVVNSKASVLDDYVAMPDDHYRWEIMNYTLNGSDFNANFTGYVLNMTSQKWLDESIIDRPIWTHALVIIVPQVINYPDKALVYNTGGSNNQFPTDWTNQQLQMVMKASRSIGCVGAVLFQTPNQPLSFADEDFKVKRSEDGIIAKTWELFLRDPQKFKQLPLRLPMVKGVVRAMDTVSQFVQQLNGNKIDKFAVAGASKRGWTTWLTAAVDKRVIAFMPIVMSLLNMRQNMHHYMKSLGGWPFAFKDYYALNITAYVDDQKMDLLRQIVDPYEYRERLTMPKVVVSSTDDQFFMIDDSHFFLKDIPGESFILFPKNTEHTTGTGLKHEAWTMATFLDMVFGGEKLPEMKWEIDSSKGTITLKTNVQPKWVRLNWAKSFNKTRRDFRIASFDNPCSTVQISGFCAQPNLYVTEEIELLKQDENGFYIYQGKKEPPAQGYLAFYLQAFYGSEERQKNGRPNALRLSTEMNIIPEGYPFEDCSGADCLGTLV